LALIQNVKLNIEGMLSIHIKHKSILCYIRYVKWLYADRHPLPEMSFPWKLLDMSNWFKVSLILWKSLIWYSEDVESFLDTSQLPLTLLFCKDRSDEDLAL